jgi:plastocyanin
MVGSMDSTTNDVTNDQRATYSETGPGVSIWAPGTDIMSSTSNTNKFSGPSYYLNASFKQCNISGTSMATPQVAGVAALVLQLNPTYTPAQVRTSLLSTAGSPIYTTGLTNDYSNTRSLLGSSQKVLYSNYNLATTTTTTVAPTTTTTTAAPTTTTTTTAAPNTFNVTNNGSGNYVIGGNSNPTLSVIEGQTCTFNINAVGHPFWIRTVAGVGITNAYNSGVTNNGEDSGTITFVVPYDAPSTLYYNCEYHSSMGGIINVTNVPTTTTTTAAPTTTTTTTEAPPCVEYRCLSSKGGYIFWTNCTTGLPASTSINGGKVKFISSITYPIPEKGSNTKITKITT